MCLGLKWRQVLVAALENGAWCGAEAAEGQDLAVGALRGSAVHVGGVTVKVEAVPAQQLMFKLPILGPQVKRNASE